MLTVFILIWLALCISVGVIANHSGRDFGYYFALSLFLTPLTGCVVLAAKEKMTEKAIIEDSKYTEENHLFYCKNCSHTLWGKTLKACPECKSSLTETDCFMSTWAAISTDKRETVMQEILDGKYDRRIK